MNSKELKKTTAFTLAETLITLVIIGVVAALTVPNMVVRAEKQKTTAKLKKFYSTMSQALMRWQQDEGLEPGKITYNVTYDEDGNRHLVSDFTTWYEQNLNKYLSNIDKSVHGTSEGRGRYTIVLSDGSGFNGYIASENTIHIFYCTEAKYCAPESYDGKHTFLFNISNGRFELPCSPASTSRAELLSSVNTTLSREGSCHCCSALIMKDSWEIKDDYPYIR